MKIILAQIIGTIAMLISISVYQGNDRKSMLFFQIASSGLFFIQYLLLGAWTGAAMNLINMFRNYVFANKNIKAWADSIAWLYIFLFTFAVITILTWQGWISLLPLLGMIAGTIAFWMTSPTRVRYLSLAGPPFWFAYNVLSKAYPALITDSMTFLSILVGIIRFDIRKEKDVEVLEDKENEGIGV